MDFKQYFNDQDNGSAWRLKNPQFLEFREKIDKAKCPEEKADLLFAFWLANRGVDEEYFKTIIDKLILEAKALKNDYALGWYNFLLGWLILDHDEGGHDIKDQRALKSLLKAQNHFKRGGIRLA